MNRPTPPDAPLDTLLAEPFASAWSTPGTAPAALRARLQQRMAASQAEAGCMHTARARRLPAETLAPGVQARTLYTAAPGQALRPGEPLRARLIELRPGSEWTAPDQGHTEWLLLRGSAGLGNESLHERDYHRAPARGVRLHSAAGAQLFLRESAAGESQALTVRDAEASWPAFAPGIARRVLWQHEGQAALLYRAEPGARVPLHQHGHDEECLMVDGELFLDDLLLQAGDYQLAPAGTSHRITETDTGAILFAHGDLDLRFV